MPQEFFAETPKKAVETTALPEATESSMILPGQYCAFEAGRYSGFLVVENKGRT
jgi:hypothetical protein